MCGATVPTPDVTSGLENVNSEIAAQEPCAENTDTTRLKPEISDSLDTNESQEADNQSKAPLYETCKHICNTLGLYLEKEKEEYFKPYLIPDKFFKRFWAMDLVGNDSKNSVCFTKR